MIKYGDFQSWCTQNLHRELEKVIKANEWRRKVYFLLVIVSDGYEGPPAGIRREIRPVKEMDFSDKKMIHNVINILDRPPLVPMIGSLLWMVNNTIGLAKCIYALPPDHPTIGPDGECSSELVTKSAQNMPIRDMN